jgi:phosphate:Na+ symporter
MILIGVTIYLGGEASPYRELGRVAVGLGLMLLALRMLLAASTPIREAEIVRQLFAALTDEALIAVLVAALLTWLAHSSLAAVLLIMSLASAGILALPVACTLVLGANLGGAIPAVTATLADEPAARRVTVGNLAFKLVGCLAFLSLIDWVVPPLTQLDPDAPRVVVNFHTGFNLALATAFILLTGPVARLCAWLLPDRPVELDPSRSRHLDRSTLDTRSLALAHAARESLRMGDFIETMLRDSFDVLRRGDPQKLR